MTPLHVTRWGQGPPVLFVHGSIFGGEVTWSAQRPLGERWSLLVIDRRGFGRSPSAEREDFLVDTADILDLLAAEDLRAVHLAGHSYGGLVAMLVAAGRPDIVASVTVIEAPIYNIAAHLPEVASHLERSRQRQAAPLEPEEFLTRFLGPREGGYPPDVVQGARLMQNQRRPWEADIPLGELLETGIPVLVVSGGQNPAMEATCDVLAERLKAEREVIQGRGHAVQRTGAAFNELLERFLLRR